MLHVPGQRYIRKLDVQREDAIVLNDENKLH